MTEKNAKYYDEILKDQYPDLYRVRQQKIKKMIKNIVIYEIMFLIFACAAYDYIVRNLAFWGDYTIVWKGIILGVIAAIVPPLCFPLTCELLPKTLFGTVINVKFEMRYPQSAGINRGINRSNAQEYVKIKIENDKKRKKMLAYRSHVSAVFGEGDRIVKFRGLAYPVKESENNECLICAVCGKIVKKEVEKCPNCCHSIINLHQAKQPKDVWAQFDYAEF